MRWIEQLEQSQNNSAKALCEKIKALQSIQINITTMEETLLGVKKDLKYIRLAQGSNQKAKVLKILIQAII